MITLTDKQFFARAGVNYFQEPGFETGTGGWRDFKTVYSSGVPTTITYQTNTRVLNGNGLRGINCLRFKGGTSDAEYGIISEVFTIDDADLAKVLTFYCDYNFTTGAAYVNASGTSSQTVEVWVYNVGLNAWTQPTGYRGINTTSGTGTLVCTFQTDSSKTSNKNQYQIAFIIKNAPVGGDFYLSLDGLYCGPQTIPVGTVATEYQDYTATLTNFGNATQKLQWARVGNLLKVRGRITIGSSLPTGDLTFTVPAGLSITWSSGSSSTFGFASTGTAAGVSGSHLGRVVYSSGSFKIAGDDGANFWTATVPVTWQANDTIDIILEGPVDGWDGTVQMSSDTDTRVAAGVLSRPSAQTITSTSDTIVQLNTSLVDTHGTVDVANYKYVIPVSGYWDLSGLIYMSSLTANEAYRGRIKVDGSAVISTVICVNQAEMTLQLPSKVVYCNAGQEITMTAQSTADTSYTVGNSSGNCYLSCQRLTGPSVIAASETVALEANTSTTTISATSAPGTNIIFTSKPTDTHNCMNLSTGVITIPTSGYYVFIVRINVNSVTASSIGDSVIIQLNVNSGTYRIIGSSQRLEQTTTAVILAPNGVIGLNLNAGDTVELEAYKSSTLVATATLSGSVNSYLSMFRVK